MERTENRTEVNIGFGKGRIESLTDGIFAFGMTLLVLGPAILLLLKRWRAGPYPRFSSSQFRILSCMSFLFLSSQHSGSRITHSSTTYALLTGPCSGSILSS